MAKRSFVVDNNTSACVLANSAVPIISLGPAFVSIGLSPGRYQIDYQLKNGKGILLLVDDAPGLVPTQMRIETDLDPRKGATADKRIEGWPRCHLGGTPTARVNAALAPNTNVAVYCVVHSTTNDLRSGCTVTSQPALIDQFRTRWLSIDEEESIDSSVWQAFGGRALRLVWITN